PSLDVRTSRHGIFCSSDHLLKVVETTQPQPMSASAPDPPDCSGSQITEDVWRGFAGAWRRSAHVGKNHNCWAANAGCISRDPGANSPYFSRALSWTVTF